MTQAPPLITGFPPISTVPCASGPANPVAAVVRPAYVPVVADPDGHRPGYDAVLQEPRQRFRVQPESDPREHVLLTRRLLPVRLGECGFRFASKSVTFRMTYWPFANS